MAWESVIPGLPHSHAGLARMMRLRGKPLAFLCCLEASLQRFYAA